MRVKSFLQRNWQMWFLFIYLTDVDPSEWPEMDSQPLSLEDAGRLRVVSAKVYSIVKNRNKGHFERVLNFLEDTYRLLPTLVSPIKHMKIVFGLKTMVHGTSPDKVPSIIPVVTTFIKPLRVRHPVASEQVSPTQSLPPL